MVPFLQNANNLQVLDVSYNNLQSEGFNFLLQSLCDSPIKELWCNECGIESIEINIDYFPRLLAYMKLSDNRINADGCREIAKLLQGGDCTLTWLSLDHNKIDDEGVAILADALQRNTLLKTLDLFGNDDISKAGKIMMLQLMNDITSIKSTLQSNHFLTYIGFIGENIQIQRNINLALRINKFNAGYPEAAGREKVIQTQLHSVRRAEWADLQGVSQSVYNEINPLHLPEVLSLVGRRHGQGELYVALKLSIVEVITTVNRRECIVRRLADLAAESEKLHAELAKIDAAIGGAMHVGTEIHGAKRHRKL